VKRTWLSFLAVGALSGLASAQQVKIAKPAPGQITHVRTALNHLTVLEMREPVSSVAVGSPAFKVEWRENKVFIEPTEGGAATNLFVWTASGRFNYELDAAGLIAQMDFAIDQPPAPPPNPKISPAQPAERGDLSRTRLLLDAQPVRQHKQARHGQKVDVYVTDLLESHGQLLVRYTVSNQARQAYAPGAPHVVVLGRPWYRESLYTLERSQLGSGEVPGLKWEREIPVEPSKTELLRALLAPGQETAGLTAIKLPRAGSRPVVLRLIFRPSSTGPVTATVVL
jgi:hypothetical protein